MLIQGFTAFSLVFFTCELGQRFSSGFDALNDRVVRLKWYSFPRDVQRMLPIIMLGVQQPVTIECFGSIVCSRETFKRVSYIVNIKLISYSMVILID